MKTLSVPNQMMSFKVGFYKAFMSTSLKPLRDQYGLFDHVYVRFFEDADCTDLYDTFQCMGDYVTLDKSNYLSGLEGSENYDTAHDLNEKMSLDFPYSINTFVYKHKGSIHLADTGPAGILYAVNGVCHTMANRILAPSKMTVDAAVGSSLSTFLFGKYGIHIPVSTVDSLIAALFNAIHIPEVIRKALGFNRGKFISFLDWALTEQWKNRLAQCGLNPDSYLCASKDSTVGEEIMRLYWDNPDTPKAELRTREFEIELKYKLPNLSEDTRKRILDAIEKLHTPAVERTVESVEPCADEINTETLVEQANERVNQHLEEVSGILSAEDFGALYNLKPGEKLDFFKHEIFKVVLDKISSATVTQE